MCVQYYRKKRVGVYSISRRSLWVCTVLVVEGGFLVLVAAIDEGVAVYILMWVCTVLGRGRVLYSW